MIVSACQTSAFRFACLLVVAIATCAQAAQAQSKTPDNSADASTLSTINVVGEGRLTDAFAGGQVARGGRLGMLGDRDYMDTPFSQASYTEALAREQQARSVADVVGNNAAVRKGLSAFGSQDNLYIRGFLVNTRDFAYDGLYGITSTRGPLIIGIERFEVLSGPGAVLFGISPSGNVGGVVNLVPKRATTTPINRATLSYLSDGNLGAAVDLGRRLGPDEALGVRINVESTDGRTPVDQNRQRFGASTLGLDWRARGMRLSGDFGYQKQVYRRPPVNLTVTPGAAIPAAPDGSRNFAQPWEHIYFEQSFGVVRGEYDLNDATTLYAAHGVSKIGEDYLTTSQRITANGQLAGSGLNPYYYHQFNQSSEAGARSRFATGAIHHEIAANVSRFYTRGKGFFGPGFAFISNFDAPTVASQPATVAMGGSGFHLPLLSTQASTSLALVDTMSLLDERVQVTLGMQRQRLETSSFDGASGALTAAYKAMRTVPLAAVLVRPWQAVSFYASYGTGLGFGATAPSTAINRNQVFPPLESRQAEIGTKFEWGELGGSVALFQVTKPATLTDPRTNVFGINGEQRNRGLEATAFGEAAPGVRLVGGLVLMKGVQTRTAGGTLDGKDAPGVPHGQANAGVDWALPGVPGMHLSTRAVYTARQYYDNANIQSIPAWTRWDAGASYVSQVSGRMVALRLNVENLTNRGYWSSTAQGLLALGGPRTVKASVAVDF